MTRPTTEELARRALETVARTHGVPVSDVHAAVRRAAEHTEALGALTPEELLKILTFANAAGAIATTRSGAIPAMPTREEITAFLEAQA